MPLSVEYLGKDNVDDYIPNGKRYSLAHHYFHEGDMFRVPDVEFIFDGKNVYPVYFMQDGGFSLRQDVFSYDDNGKASGYCKSLANDIKNFCNMWMVNIKEQQEI